MSQIEDLLGAPLLEAYGIPHQYENYEGDHINRIAERIRTRTLPFFSEHLEFE